MKKIIPWLNDSSYIEPISPACKMCAEGSKMVVLISGLCLSNCYYCPLSSKKLGKDFIYADEWKLENEKDTEKLILEAEYIKATGAGITGGDPLFVWERTKRYIKLLKENFGESFHIHLYTSGLSNIEHIADLVSAGLDEIRFHPLPKHWGDMHKSPTVKGIINSLETDVDVSIEIPVIPEREDPIFSLIKWADEKNLKWVNLNELEFSETNAEKLINRGFSVKDDISSAVKGSQNTAESVLDMVSLNDDISIGVHFCSSSFKDGIQLKNRIKRRAESIANEYEVISDEGTLLKGIICPGSNTLDNALIALQDKYRIEQKFFYLDKEKNRIEIGVWILEKIAEDLSKNGFECYMVEEYPTADHLEVERIPLPL